MRRFVSMLVLMSVALSVNSCAGFEKGDGISSFDTDSEDAADKKWFSNYYGEKNTTCDDSFWTTKPFCSSD